MSRGIQNEECFTLSKWYLDCVTDPGEVFIGYAARIGWRGVRVGYSGVLQYSERSGARAAASLRGFQAPEPQLSGLAWSSASLGVQGQWAADQQPIERRLLELDGGALDWRCLQPRSRVAVQARQGGGWQGLGYAENVRLTFRPWRLPIDELRWGRFVCANEALVWIDWRGPRPLTLVFRNGRRQEESRVGDDAVLLEGGRVALDLTEKSELRSGRLVSTALSRTPLLNRLLPEKILNTYECKWRSRGILRRDQEVVAEGWAIHEVVRWKKQRNTGWEKFCTGFCSR